MSGIRDAQGGYGNPKKKNPFAPTGADTTRDAQGGYGTTTYNPTAGYSPTTSLPGFMPDYTKLIAGDPALNQILADLGAASTGDLGSRNAAINRAFTQFGAVPDLQAAQKALGLTLTDVVDPTTAELAQKNPYSTQANLAKAHTDAVAQIRHALAARGALQSGALGTELANENRAYGQAQSDSTQKLLDLVAGYQQAFADAERQRLAQKNTAYGDAANRQVTLNPPTGTKTLPLNTEASQKWGKPLYSDADGTLHNPDGSVFTPPAQTPGVNPNTGTSGGIDLGPVPAGWISAGGPLPGPVLPPVQPDARLKKLLNIGG